MGLNVCLNVHLNDFGLNIQTVIFKLLILRLFQTVIDQQEFVTLLLAHIHLLILYQMLTLPLSRIIWPITAE